MNKIIKVFVLVFALFVAFACKDDKPATVPPTEVSQFIWDALDYWYLWRDDVAGLQLERGSDEWKTYLNENGGSKKNTEGYSSLFESLLHRKPNAKGEATLDKWSWFIEDYVKQEEAFAGVTKSFGYNFKLAYYEEAKGTIYGAVTYVVPYGPAYSAGVRRGDIFRFVDGVELTVSNYKHLLFGQDSYTLGINIPVNKKVENMVAVEKFEENPILKTQVFENIGGKRVGYLVYNGFVGTNKFNLALNDSFGQLKSAGIDELVLDLRYNGGGDIYTSMLLATMIDGTHPGEVYANKEYNKIVEAELLKARGESFMHYTYPTKILDVETDISNELAPINSLGLSKLYVLVSGNTASASEMVINGLRAYLGDDNVILIGTQTHGKYVGSITTYDWRRDSNGKLVKNPNHKYAMQPIVLKISNAKGVSDYVDGFAPKYKRDEFSHIVYKFDQLKPLGDPEEYLLGTALDIIAGKNVSEEEVKAIGGTRSANIGNRGAIYNSLDDKPLANQMYDRQLGKQIRDMAFQK